MILNLTHLNIKSDIKLKRINFQNESLLKINGSVKNKKIKVITCVMTDEDFLFLMDVCLDLIKKQCKKINVYFTYIYYSTQERSDDQEVNKFKNRMYLLSQLKNVNFYFFDIHKEYSLNYIENLSSFKNIKPNKLIKNLKTEFDIIASPDQGNLKNVMNLSSLLKKDYAFCLKERKLDNVESLAVIGSVKDKNVIICDDMVRSGKTLILAAKSFREKGAKKISVYVTHNLMRNNEIFKYVDVLYTTNSIESKFKNKKIKIINIEKIIKEYL